MSTPDDTPLPAPHPDLIVVGAAGEMARLLTSEVFSKVPWECVWLLDTSPAVASATVTLDPRSTVRRGVVDATSGTVREVGGTVDGVLDLAGLDAAVCVAVPHARLQEAAGWLLPRLARSSTVFDVSSEKTRALATLSEIAGDLALFGTHPLFGHAVGTVEGQTVVVCPSPTSPDSHLWLEAALREAGAIAKEMSAERHDLVMAYVQTAAHQALLAFADVVVHSGLDLDEELWACRTPPFETLMALVSRLLTPTQVTTVASIQLATDGARIATELAAAVARTQDAIASGSVAEVEGRLVDLREGVSGSLFNRMQQASNLAIRAIQSPRTLLSHERRTGSLVGISPKTQPEKLRVGLVDDVTATTVRIENLLVGRKGEAALLGPYRSAAKRMGVGGQPTVVEFSLGNVDLLLGPDLEAALEDWLGDVTTDIRLLGPESVDVTSMAKLVQDEPRVRHTELVYEIVRAGQREFVIRCNVRADSDIEGLAGALQARLDDRYTWPKGVLAPSMRMAAATAPLDIAYLGPPGTFSATAAATAAGLVGDAVGELLPVADFPSLLEQVATESVRLGVLPVCNSGSGVVEPAIEALIDGPDSVTAVGMVDVPVRLDAYARPGSGLVAGGAVISQTQGLLQAKRFVARYGLETHTCSSTVEGLQQLADGRHDIALAPPGMGDQYGLRVVAPNVGDLPGAITRFLVLARRDWFDARVSTGPQSSDTEVSTARSLWVVPHGIDVRTPPGPARVDEVLTAPGGLQLWVSTDQSRFTGVAGVRPLGVIPWSPRTPVVDL